VWTLDQAITYIQAGTWPIPGGPFFIGLLGDVYTNTASGINYDSSGNVYLNGYSNSSGTYDFQIAKYNASGAIQWQRRLGGAGASFGTKVATDSSGNVYFVGYSSGSGTTDSQIAKYNTSGTIQWQRRFGGSGFNNNGNGIVVDSSGNIYFAGYTYTTSSGITNGTIAKYNSSGTIQWQKGLGGIASSPVYFNSIAVDSSDNLYVVQKYRVPPPVLE
jgi:hypothetical protein